VTNWLNTVLVPALVSGSLYALVACGFNVLARTTGILNFAHGNLITWAPLAVLLCWRGLDMPVVLSFACGLAMVLAGALVAERIAIRPFIQSGASLPWILSTLGVAVILGHLGTLPFRGDTLDFPWHLGFDPIYLGGVRVTPVQLTTIGVAVAVVAALWLFYRHTNLGRQLEAVAEDLDGARAIGIFSSRMSQIAAGISALLAILTGWVVAPTLQVTASIGLTLTFTGFVATAIGGIGSIAGGLAGGMVVGFVSQLTVVYLGSSWVDGLLFGCLLVIYLMRPTGLFGTPTARTV
jgi:branched-chain amino acid transport system permease protein